MWSFLSFLGLLLVTVVSAISTTGDRLLVILDDVADKASYSQFLGDLEGRGFTVAFETPKSESLSLFRLGERAYDHVVFLPTNSKGLGPNLTPALLLQFINQNGNILLALSASTPTPVSFVSLLAELDIQLPADRTALVVDHFNYDTASAADKHDVLLLPAPRPSRSDVKDFFGGSSTSLLAFPRGLGVTLGAGELLTSIVRAPRTAYSYNPKEASEAVGSDDLFAAGEQLALVSAFQARNSARFTIVGSAEMLQDAWFDAEVKTVAGATAKTDNREFAKRVSGWTFQELGVLRVNWIEHHLNEEGVANMSNPEIYRIKNDVTYSISLSEYAWSSWTAFAVPANDVLQLEFSMLSPFHRLPLVQDAAQSTAEAAVYTVSFTVPDQHGIFNFKVNYKRPFLSNVEEKNTVSVRHMAHDEWPRSYAISGAWPWISGIAATVAGWLAFCALWMYSAPTEKKKENKKTQ
ncbi:Dolichyl-diphosphooligosaccharide--protein glycosyltransferase subunit WBP1 [Podospora appendiculata]|uniref:Dolichyl-diphosphooligosaccharide--protein glycosyltransferase subunit WBP1 n=1 Tax=Podospora appendiculata TaxID=314037 RepID=A0AAE0XIV0_9PEZI|nr:Dolichyl-diphosphooligosaccharide--protein glycosyltransferase subunit WBP1 [Podospora appendiculata]